MWETDLGGGYFFKSLSKILGSIPQGREVPGEPTPAVPDGLAIAHLGQVLHCCLLTPNSFFQTSI